ncbi:MAG: hypothetical protein ACREQL_11095, partial [Candidatus Binatia bacterium]
NWKWVSSAVVQPLDLGDPTVGTDVTICVFDQTGRRLSATAPAGGTCSGKPCWNPSSTGYKYKSRDLTPQGLQAIALKPGPAGKAKVKVKGKGSNLVMPMLGLTTPARVQLRRGDAPACWEAVFDTPTTNTGSVFRGKSN